MLGRSCIVLNARVLGAQSNGKVLYHGSCVDVYLLIDRDSNVW